MKSVDVIFRKWNDGSIMALFPYCVENYDGCVLSYELIGQHSLADYRHCIRSTKLAKKEEYEPLKKELENIGYKLNITKRQNYNKFLLSLNKLIKRS